MGKKHKYTRKYTRKKNGQPSSNGTRAKKNTFATKIKGKSLSKKHKVLAALLILAVAGSLVVVFTVQSFQAGSMVPSDIDEEDGYAVFSFIDGETGKPLSGSVLLFYSNNPNIPMAGPIATGATIELKVDEDNPVMATLYSVDLPTKDNRSFLSTTYNIEAIGYEDEPTTNTLTVNFKLNPANVTVNITDSSPDNRIGPSYNETSFQSNIEYEIQLNISVDMRGIMSMWGHSSYVPDYLLPELNSNNSVDFSGGFLMFNGTDILSAEVEEFGSYTNYFYIDEWDASIIQLFPVFGTGVSQTVKFKLSANPTAMYVFEGLLTDYGKTRVQIV